MQLLFKQFDTPDGRRSMYVAIPDDKFDPMWKPSCITILREADDEASVLALIEQAGLRTIVDEHRSYIAFPNPVNGHWDVGDGIERSADMKMVIEISSAFLPGGICSNGWRTSGDVRYLVGIGSGATLVQTAAACYPTFGLAAAICTVGGQMPDWALARATGSPVPALLIGADERTRSYYISANKAERQADDLYVCRYNPAQQVQLAAGDALTAELGDRMWQLFRRTRRTNTSPWGDVDRRILLDEDTFHWHVHETLGDNNGLDHDWLEYIPSCVRENPDKKVPVVLCSHGMGENPLKFADELKLHELGEREGFITVYLFSCDRNKWNLSCDPALYSDVDYYVAMIDYLKRTYPVDETRIYTTGFSNGAGMAMLFALVRPDLIAASFPVDSTFPYAAMGFFRGGMRPKSYLTPVLEPGQVMPGNGIPKESPEKNLAPLKAALERQKEKAYRLPVMYFYGTRENEYPIRHGCNQELSYNFWKEFNNIPLKETVDCMEPDAVGVAGDEIRAFTPSAAHPDHTYVEHTFYSVDGNDDYHFVILRGKAHDVHPVERELGWAYASRFRRLADGTLVDSRKN